MGAPELEGVAAAVTKRVERFIAAKRPDVVKLVYDNHADMPDSRPGAMPLAVARAIVSAAKAKGVKTVAHVGPWRGVEELANLGVSAVTHLPNGPAPPSAIAALRSHDVAVITTMAIYQDYGDMAHDDRREAFTRSEYMTTLAPTGLVSAYRAYSGYDPAEKAWVTWGDRHNALGSQPEVVFKGKLVDRRALSLTSGE